MKRILLILCAAFTLLLLPQKAQAEITIDFFYDSLQPYGDWLYLDDYGYCWQPLGVDADWRPYTDGYWTYTDFGWTWVSYEDFGWATYHYGRWIRLENIGWVWVPGYEWGAAWVSWRYSDEYVGWAPLPPQAICTPEYAIDSYVDVDYDLGPEYYTFTTCQSFGSPYIRQVIIRPEINITIIHRTVNVTNISFHNNVIVFGGPRFDRIARFTERPIERLKIERRVDIDMRGVDRNFYARKKGGNLIVVAPDVAPLDRDIKPRKIKETLAQATPDRGWSGIRDKTLADETRRKIREQNTQPRLSQAPDREARRPATEMLRREARRPSVKKADSPDTVRQPDQPQATPIAQENPRENPRNQNPRRNQDRQTGNNPADQPANVTPVTPAPRDDRPNKRVNREAQSQPLAPTPQPETARQPNQDATRRQQAAENARNQQDLENTRRQQAREAAAQRQQAQEAARKQQAIENTRRQQTQDAASQRQQAAENARRQQAREQAANQASQQESANAAREQARRQQAATEQQQNQRAQQAARQQQQAEQARTQQQIQQRRQQAAQQQQQPAQPQRQKGKGGKKADPEATPTPN